MLQGRTVFSWYDGRESLERDYEGRIHLLDDEYGQGRYGRLYGQGSINLTNIRESDQGWYECRVIFPNRTPNSRNNGTWFHLAIHGKFFTRRAIVRLFARGNNSSKAKHRLNNRYLLMHLSTNCDIINLLIFCMFFIFIYNSSLTWKCIHLAWRYDDEYLHVKIIYSANNVLQLIALT